MKTKLLVICFIIAMFTGAISVYAQSAPESILIEAENYAGMHSSSRQELAENNTAMYFKTGWGWAVYAYDIPSSGLYQLEVNVKAEGSVMPQMFVGQSAATTAVLAAEIVKPIYAGNSTTVGYTWNDAGLVYLDKAKYLSIQLPGELPFYLDAIRLTRVSEYDSNDLSIYYVNVNTIDIDQTAGGGASSHSSGGRNHYSSIRNGHTFIMNDKININSSGKYKMKINAATSSERATGYTVYIDGAAKLTVPSGNSVKGTVTRELGTFYINEGSYDFKVLVSVSGSDVAMIDYFTLEKVTEPDIIDGSVTVLTNSSTAVDYNITNSSIAGQISATQIGIRTNNYASFYIINDEEARYKVSVNTASKKNHIIKISAEGKSLISQEFPYSSDANYSTFVDEVFDGSILLPAGPVTVTLTGHNILSNDAIFIKSFTLTKVPVSFKVDGEISFEGGETVTASVNLIKRGDIPAAQNKFVLAQYTSDHSLVKLLIEDIDLSDADIGDAIPVSFGIEPSNEYESGYIKAFIWNFSGFSPYCESKEYTLN